MRLAYAYFPTERNKQFRKSIDTTVEEFSETHEVKQILVQVRTPEDYKSYFFSRIWIQDFQKLLGKVLVKNRKTLSIASCFSENELPYILEGYDITCSDILVEPLRHTQELFPQFRYTLFNIFSDKLSEEYDDLLITGLDYVFDNDSTKIIFEKCAEILKFQNGGHQKRLLFTLRYNDNWGTKLIDLAILPFEAATKNFIYRTIGSNRILVKKAHGYRKSREEILALAREAGFKLVSTHYTGFGNEIARSSVLSNRFRPLVKLLSKLDQRMKMFNNITLFEFTL